MVILWAGKVLSFVILHQILLKSGQVSGTSEVVSWFPEYHKCKCITQCCMICKMKMFKNTRQTTMLPQCMYETHHWKTLLIFASLPYVTNHIA